MLGSPERRPFSSKKWEYPSGLEHAGSEVTTGRFFGDRTSRREAGAKTFSHEWIVVRKAREVNLSCRVVGSVPLVMPHKPETSATQRGIEGLKPPLRCWALRPSVNASPQLEVAREPHTAERAILQSIASSVREV
jgi:hypothetical protein